MLSPRPVAAALGGLACLLASTALAPLFEGILWWFRPVLIATVVAVGTAVLGRLIGRSLRLPALTGFSASLIGLAVAVTAIGARDTAILGLIPTPGTATALADLVDPTMDEVRELAVPVPERPGLVVLVLVATYVVAMAVDLLVVVADRPALAGIPLLAVFLVPATVLPAGVGTLPFILGAVGFVALMLLDGRRMVTRWGRPVGDRPARAISSGLAALGVQIAAGSLVIASLLPLVLPSLDGKGVISANGGSGSGSGRNSASVIQPIVSLFQQIHDERDLPLLRVTTETPQNLRLTALENFDGQRFTLRALNATKDARVDRTLPGPEEDIRTIPAVTEVSVSPEMAERYLPVPGIPTRFTGLEGDWRLANPTGTIFSTRTSTSGQDYTVHAQIPAPTPEEISAARGPRPASMDVVTALPASLDSRLPGLLAEITEGVDSDYDKVVEIQNFLRGPAFTYDLSGAPTVREGALADFLFTSRRGYCEQFASAMAVLVRLLGLPSRVAIGFTHGMLQNDGTWLITNKQAHAWPEVWFPTLGWIPFEPTKRGDGTTPAPAYAPSTDEPTGPDASAEGEPAVETEVAPVPVVTPVPAEPDAAGQDPAMEAEAAPEDAENGGAIPDWLVSAWLVWVLVGLGVLGLFSIPALTRLLLRRRRMSPVSQRRMSPSRRRRTTRVPRPNAAFTGTGAPGAEDADTIMNAAAVAQVDAAWAELVDVAADLRIRLHRSDSPRSGVQRLITYLEAGPEEESAEVNAASQALIRLATAQEQARYAPPGTYIPDPSLLDDLTLVRRVLWSVTPRSQRALALVAPPSMLRRIEGIQVRQVTDWVRRRRSGTAKDDLALSGTAAESAAERRA
ncbi:transglutaminaseTgpA domain-containing protein [Parafrankia sp. FMc2]|uniref:transglutaminase family protein n=1 Tax=Parafrankia sp. FMc2 TaxID=3233196 RepID=UPI0034D4BED4